MRWLEIIFILKPCCQIIVRKSLINTWGFSFFCFYFLFLWLNVCWLPDKVTPYSFWKDGILSKSNSCDCCTNDWLLNNFSSSGPWLDIERRYKFTTRYQSSEIPYNWCDDHHCVCTVFAYYIFWRISLTSRIPICLHVTKICCWHTHM